MLAVNVLRVREAAPGSAKQVALADDDDEAVTTTALGLVRATKRAPTSGDHDAMATLSPTERRRTTLRMGYAACLLPG